MWHKTQATPHTPCEYCGKAEGWSIETWAGRRLARCRYCAQFSDYIGPPPLDPIPSNTKEARLSHPIFGRPPVPPITARATGGAAPSVWQPTVSGKPFTHLLDNIP